jgi:CrcB protein
LPLNPPPRAIVLAFAGGAAGTLVRALIGLSFETPVTLLIVNLLGTAFLGYINGSSGRERPRFHSAAAKWFWGAGFCGGFTTMSGLALAFVMFTANSGVIASLVYVLLQFAAGLLAYALAFRIGRGAWPNVV